MPPGSRSRDPEPAHVAMALALLIIGGVIAAMAHAETTEPEIVRSTIDAGAVLDTLLLCTVPEVEYTDAQGTTTSFQGMTVTDLVIVDINLRYEPDDLNTSSLDQGIESAIEDTLVSLAANHHYRFKASYKGTFFKIFDLNLEGGTHAGSELGTGSPEGKITVTLDLV